MLLRRPEEAVRGKAAKQPLTSSIRAKARALKEQTGVVVTWEQSRGLWGAYCCSDSVLSADRVPALSAHTQEDKHSPPPKPRVST